MVTSDIFQSQSGHRVSEQGVAGIATFELSGVDEIHTKRVVLIDFFHNPLSKKVDGNTTAPDTNSRRHQQSPTIPKNPEENQN